MTTSLHRILPTLLALLLSLSSAGAQEAPSQLNKRLQINLLVDPSVSPAEGVRKRVREGLNLQALIAIPEATNAGGPLLDPRSLSVRWNKTPLHHFVYYKAPQTALVFALVPPEVIEKEPKGEVVMNARLLSSKEDDAGWRLPLEFTADDVTTMTASIRAKTGRRVRMVDEAGKPVAGAYLFGQRRSDLFAESGEDGLVVLDAPSRNSNAPHLAWSPGHWTTSFDPITTQTITLSPKPGPGDRKVTLRLQDAAGAPIKEALVLIDESNDFFHYQDGVSMKMTIPGREVTPVIIIAAGYTPKHVELTEEDGTRTVKLENRIVLPARPPGTPRQ